MRRRPESHMTRDMSGLVMPCAEQVPGSHEPRLVSSLHLASRVTAIILKLTLVCNFVGL